MIASEWKLLNKECFDINQFSAELSFYREACLNLARLVPLMYSYDDNQRLPVLEEYVDLMLLKPKPYKVSSIRKGYRIIYFKVTFRL
ncbi:hypothetical protein MIMGU_mgv11b022451mg [Erythranthe guttata]|uniref:Uncharacterized protein n=1 Tax=Erythranthe guttata TaxID=4155 RepID=A0A022R2V9_ERYGU|nr:hypothetical protein MIMGU_mgv11b022451mg [Erythranthe guttata]